MSPSIVLSWRMSLSSSFCRGVSRLQVRFAWRMSPLSSFWYDVCHLQLSFHGVSPSSSFSWLCRLQQLQIRFVIEYVAYQVCFYGMCRLQLSFHVVCRLLMACIDSINKTNENIYLYENWSRVELK